MAARLDLSDDAVRAQVTAGLGRLYAGQPVLVATGALSAVTPLVRWLRALGCPVLVVCTARGPGEVPGPDEAEVIEVPAPAVASVTDETRTHERVFRALPATALEAIERFDSDRRGRWVATPFITTDELIAARPVTAGRPAAWIALEDKLLAEGLWRSAGVTAAPHRVVPVDRAALESATTEVAGPLGAVWSGDTREGSNGGGDYVRWVATEQDALAAFAFFAPRCDRVRVQPFLDGVPCSIHGLVLRDGTAVFRPVEIAVLRDPARRTFTHGGLGTFWDPPPEDREAMRRVARRVGDHLAATWSYRGAFGVDGVLTADGFRPTELNPRLSAGLVTVVDVDRPFLALLQANLVAGVDTGLGVADLESLLTLTDDNRSGRASVLVEGLQVGEAHDVPVTWDGRTLCRAVSATDDVVALADTASGCLATLARAPFLRPGDRLAPVVAALADLLDREYDAGLGPLEAAPDVREVVAARPG